MHETNYHEKNIFVTLTYEDDQLPETQEISKPELQKFIKRLRKHLGDQKIRYYAVGEYGEQTQRPHYHAIIFGLGLEDHKVKKTNTGYHILGGPIEKSWKYGFTYGGTVTPESTLYVAGYIQKKLYGPPAVADGREQPFALMSNKLGAEWVEKNWDMIKENLSITFHGKNYPIPRYYKKILMIEDDMRLFAKMAADSQRATDRYNAWTTHYRRQQENKNLQALDALKESTL